MQRNPAGLRHALLHWARVPVAVFVLAFVTSLGYFELDDGEGAAGPREEQHGETTGRLVVTYSATAEDPTRGFLAGLALDGSDRRTVVDPRGGAAVNVAPSVAADGVSVAFQRSEEGEPPYIHLVPLDGSKPERRLTRGHAPEVDPTWSPHGDRIAFSREVNGSFDLFACSRNGSELVRLTATPGVDELGAVWSPGNDRIAFARYDDGSDKGSGDLWITSTDGRMEQSRLGDDHDYGSPSWSPDARRLAFLMDGHVAIMDAEGGVPQQLTPPGELKETRPSWSPDGRRIAFTRDPGTIVTMNPDGSGPRRVPLDAAANGVAWEPAG
jgi:TolB protein